MNRAGCFLIAIVAAFGAAPALAQHRIPPLAQREAPTPPTPENIKAQCWMQFEKQKTKISLDKKLELVERCIEEKSRAVQR
jgi:hypothetical protein